MGTLRRIKDVIRPVVHPGHVLAERSIVRRLPVFGFIPGR